MCSKKDSSFGASKGQAAINKEPHGDCFEREKNQILDRVKNFYWDSEKIKSLIIDTSKNIDELYGVENQIVSTAQRLKKISVSEITGVIFSELYNFTVKQDPSYMMFHRESPFYTNMFDACLYTALCMFLHDSRKCTRGKSLRRFVYDNSPNRFNEKDSKYYFPFEHPSDDLFNEEKVLRKSRNRILSDRPVYDKRPEWSGMPKDSEYEWTFYYDLQIEGDVVRDTYKRIGNLYKDINKAIESTKDEEYNNRLASAYKKFQSKLSKIKYENYIEIQRTILSYLKENKEYMGINIYRFEKEMRPSIMPLEVNLLMKCKNEEEEVAVITNSVILHNIWYPNLYIDFASNPSCTVLCGRIFHPFLDYIVILSCLILDELIEKDYLGENWEHTFREMLNNMSTKVFHTSKVIDSAITQDAQEKFERIMSAFVSQYLISLQGSA